MKEACQVADPKKDTKKIEITDKKNDPEN